MKINKKISIAFWLANLSFACVTLAQSTPWEIETKTEKSVSLKKSSDILNEAVTNQVLGYNTGQQGDTCNRSNENPLRWRQFECAPGLYCSENNTCEPQSAPEAPCDTFDSCAQGICTKGKCPQIIPNPPICVQRNDIWQIPQRFDTQECPPGYVCPGYPNNPLLPVRCALPCTHYWKIINNCPAGTVCSGSESRPGYCMPSTIGKDCKSTTCEYGYYCSESELTPRCVPKIEPGGSCVGDRWTEACAPGYVCLNGTCQVVGAPGDRCYGYGCRHGECVNGRCVALDPVAPGGFCKSSLECGAGYSCHAGICQQTNPVLVGENKK